MWGEPFQQRHLFLSSDAMNVDDFWRVDMLLNIIVNATRYPPRPNWRPLVVARGCGIACPISTVYQTQATAAADMYIHTDMDTDLGMGLDMEHRKSDMFIKHMKNACCAFKQAFCTCLIDMYYFRRAPNKSHSNNSKSNVAVARVSWVSMFTMWV